MSREKLKEIYTKKRQVLTQWVEDIAQNGIKQRTPEWLEARKNRVGGSSIVAFTDYKGFETVESFISRNLGRKTDSNIYMNWGIVFEEVIMRYIETVFDIAVEADSAYCLNEKYPHCHYSPDGLALMELDKFLFDTEFNHRGLLKKLNIPAEAKIVLLEFKCPSAPVSDTMPEKYIPQLKMGMNMIDIAEIGLLVEANFKLSAPEDCAFDNPKFIDFKRGNTPCEKTAHTNMPLAIGHFTILSSSANATNDIYADIYNGGTADIFAELAKGGKIVSMELTLKTNKDYITKTYEFVGEANASDKASESNLFCTTNLYFKMFDISYHIVEKDDGFLDALQGKIKEAIDTINICMEYPEHSRAGILQQILYEE